MGFGWSCFVTLCNRARRLRTLFIISTTGLHRLSSIMLQLQSRRGMCHVVTLCYNYNLDGGRVM